MKHPMYPQPLARVLWLILLAAQTGTTGSLAAGVLTNATDLSLRQMVKAGGRITVAVDGTVTLTNTIVVSTNTTLDATGRALVLSGGLAVRLFVINPGVTLTLKNLSLLGGKQSSTNANTGGIAAAAGGAIYNNGGVLVMTDSSLVSHTTIGLAGADGAGVTETSDGKNGGDGEATRGGALFNNAGTILLSNCVVSANLATGGKGGNGSSAAGAGNGRAGGNGGAGGGALGGAIYNYRGSLSVYYSSFGTNAANSASGGTGGTGVGFFGFNGKPGRTSDAAGGAIYNDGGTVLLINSTFAGNQVLGAAGAAGSPGIYEYEGDDGQPGATATGEAIASTGGLVAGTNLTFYANVVLGGPGGSGGSGGPVSFGGPGGDGGPGGSGQGGAIYGGPGSKLTMINVTASDNSAAGGAGGAAGTAGNSLANPGDTGAVGVGLGGAVYAGGELSTGNSIFNNSLSGQNLAGTIIDLGSNISSDASTALRASSSLTSVDPQLLPIAANGGPTLTMGIATNSPAANKGNEAYCLPVDQRGFPRNGKCDIGAFEAGSLINLTLTLQGTNSLALRWFGFNVETSANVAGTNASWTTVTPTAVNGIQTFQTNTTSARAFFRPAKTNP